MSKHVTISAALAAMLLLAAGPASAQRQKGPSDLRDADRPEQTAIAIPALIRSRAQGGSAPPADQGDKATLSCRKSGGDASATGNGCAGKVKVFDGAGGPDIRAADGQSSDPDAVSAQNNMKQIGMAHH